jgi:hypothetical protein
MNAAAMQSCEISYAGSPGKPGAEAAQHQTQALPRFASFF